MTVFWVVAPYYTALQPRRQPSSLFVIKFIGTLSPDSVVIVISLRHKNEKEMPVTHPNVFNSCLDINLFGNEGVLSKSLDRNESKRI
jgi:hypothetical protein